MLNQRIERSECGHRKRINCEWPEALQAASALAMCQDKYHKMHPQQYSGDQDAFKITLGNLRVGDSKSGGSCNHAHVVL
ncbi:hypothetical protein YC2023_090013 [Brassica napus]